MDPKKTKVQFTSLILGLLLGVQLCASTARNAVSQEELTPGSSSVPLSEKQAGRVEAFQKQLKEAASDEQLIRQLQQQGLRGGRPGLDWFQDEVAASQETTPACDEVLREELKSFFGSVVLVINYNEDAVARNTSAFWRKLYSRFFLDVLLIGPNPNEELGIIARGPAPFRWAWQHQYWALPRIISRYPQAEGFLYTNDDVVINYWNLLRADKTKLWLPNDLSKTAEHAQYPFNPSVNIEPEYEGNSKATRVAVSEAYKAMPAEHSSQYRSSIYPTVDHYQKRVCDVFYVPRRLAEAFAFDLLPHFREARVPHEVAIPTMFYALEHPNNFDRVLDGTVYRWDHYCSDAKVREGYNPEDFWSKDLTAFHPWKVADEHHRKRLVLALSQDDSCICEDFPGSCVR